MKGKLYVVATPIGNLADITIRALDILKQVHVIACEDTRNTKKLLNFYGIEKKRLISYHEHNEERQAQLILEILKNDDVALVSDAGTPCISDPGYNIVKLCRENGVDVVPIPGAFAGAVALSASGLPTDRFLFVGFLSSKQLKKLRQLKDYIGLGYTFILYESPNRVLDTLEKINNLDKDAYVMVAKELTKIHERFVYGTAEKVLKFFNDNPDLLKGEFVIIINPSKNQEEIDISQEVSDLVRSGKPAKEIVKILSSKYKIPKNKIYRKVLEVIERL